MFEVQLPNPGAEGSPDPGAKAGGLMGQKGWLARKLGKCLNLLGVGRKSDR